MSGRGQKEIYLGWICVFCEAYDIPKLLSCDEDHVICIKKSVMLQLSPVSTLKLDVSR